MRLRVLVNTGNLTPWTIMKDEKDAWSLEKLSSRKQGSSRVS